MPLPTELIAENALDRRKLSALKFWGLIEDTGTTLRLSERGLLVARDHGANRVAALREVVASIAPYASVIARAFQNNEMVVSELQKGLTSDAWWSVARASRRASSWPKTMRGHSPTAPKLPLRSRPKAWTIIRRPRRSRAEIKGAQSLEPCAEVTGSSSPAG